MFLLILSEHYPRRNISATYSGSIVPLTPSLWHFLVLELFCILFHPTLEPMFEEGWCWAFEWSIPIEYSRSLKQPLGPSFVGHCWGFGLTPIFGYPTLTHAGYSMVQYYCWLPKNSRKVNFECSSNMLVVSNIPKMSFDDPHGICGHGHPRRRKELETRNCQEAWPWHQLLLQVLKNTIIHNPWFEQTKMKMHLKIFEDVRLTSRTKQKHEPRGLGYFQTNIMIQWWFPSFIVCITDFFYGPKPASQASRVGSLLSHRTGFSELCPDI